MQDRFDEAVQLAEEAFAAELARLVSHLTERLAVRRMASRRSSGTLRWRI